MKTKPEIQALPSRQFSARPYVPPRPVVHAPVVVVRETQPALPQERCTAIFAGWLLLGIGLIPALIPVLGLIAFSVSVFFCIAAGILGIIGAARSRPVAGVVLFLASFVAAFVYVSLPVAIPAIWAALTRPPA